MKRQRSWKNGILVREICDGREILENLGARMPVKSPCRWPLPLLPLKLLAVQGDRGAGDIIARAIGPIGGDAFKTWYKKIFGKGCGCAARQEALNARWPL